MKYQHRVMGMLSLLAVITYLDRVCIAVAGPRMQDDLGISPEAWGWVSSIFFISYAAFEIPSGLMGDRIGPRTVLTRIVAWWSVFTSLTGIVASYPWLLFVRFCFGMGEAAVSRRRDWTELRIRRPELVSDNVTLPIQRLRESVSELIKLSEDSDMGLSYAIRRLAPGLRGK